MTSTARELRRATAHRALARRLQDIKARQEAFPKVFEKGTIDGLQRGLVGGIDADVELSDWDESFHLLWKLTGAVRHKLLIQMRAMVDT